MKEFKEISEKMGRQLKDPKKEVMVVKKVGGKDKVITIDKSQEKDYLRKGWKLAEGKVRELQMKRQDMAKLASLYSKAMKAMPGSPKQKALKKQIDQYRRELGMNESLLQEFGKVGRYIVTAGPGDNAQKVIGIEKDQSKAEKIRDDWNKKNKPSKPSHRARVYAQTELSSTKSDIKVGKDISWSSYGNKLAFKKIKEELSLDEGLKDGYIVYKKMGISKIKKVATLKTMPKGKMLDKVLDKYDADGVIAMSKVLRNKMQVEAVTEAKGKYASDAQMDDFLKAMEKHPDVKKMSKHYNRPVGDIVNALRARVSVNRLRGGNVYTLNFTDKDSKLKVKAKKQYAPIKEAVSPAQQAAIAISKKEKGEKPKNEMEGDNFRPHPMYAPNGTKHMAHSYQDHLRMKKMGYTHHDPKANESRAYRDAMKSMKSRSATRGMATTKKDKDTEASDDDRKAANKNIIMQLRKAADLSTGAEIEFERGKGKVSRSQAQAALARFNALAKPRDKEKFQKSIRSLSDIKKILGR